MPVSVMYSRCCKAVVCRMRAIATFFFCCKLKIHGPEQSDPSLSSIFPCAQLESRAFRFWSEPPECHSYPRLSDQAPGTRNSPDFPSFASFFFWFLLLALNIPSSPISLACNLVSSFPYKSDTDGCLFVFHSFFFCFLFSHDSEVMKEFIAETGFEIVPLELEYACEPLGNMVREEGKIPEPMELYHEK